MSDLQTDYTGSEARAFEEGYRRALEDLAASKGIPRHVPPLLTPGDAARVLGVNTDALKYLRQTGKLEAIQYEGAHPRYTREALRDYAEAQAITPQWHKLLE